jgi:predicted transcriptional regulator
MTSTNAPFVFSIRPQFIVALLDGSKSKGDPTTWDPAYGAWEYRTRRPSVEIGDQILIYESRGRGMIVAIAEVLELLVDTVDAVREQTSPADDFDEYFAGRDIAVAMRLHVRELDEPIALVQSAPQCWARYRGAWPIAA